MFTKGHLKIIKMNIKIFLKALTNFKMDHKAIVGQTVQFCCIKTESSNKPMYVCKYLTHGEGRAQ